MTPALPLLLKREPRRYPAVIAGLVPAIHEPRIGVFGLRVDAGTRPGMTFRGCHIETLD
jgi:hypothetical protein